MTNEEIVKTLRTCGGGSCDDCIKPAATCASVYIAAADAIEDLKQLADNIEEERKCLEEEVHRLNDERHQYYSKLACKERECELLDAELRFVRLYVAAETRADTGVNPEALDDE